MWRKQKQNESRLKDYRQKKKKNDTLVARPTLHAIFTAKKL